MTEWTKAAGGLFSSTKEGVEKLDPEGISSDTDRAGALEELNKLNEALWFLLPKQEVFIGDIGSYVELAEDDGFDSPSQREAVWGDAVRRVDEISEGVVKVLDVLTQGDSQLQIAIADADRVTLRSALMHRATILQRFAGLEPPTTSGEIAQLELLAERYYDLHKAARDLHVSLQAALVKFGP